MIVESDKTSIGRQSGFIVLEGVNGAGKGTVKAAMMELLRSAGVPAIETFEPGDNQLGRQLRPILLGGESEWRSPAAELFLMAADRAAHVQQIIRPAIDAGKVVICDR